MRKGILQGEQRKRLCAGLLHVHGPCIGTWEHPQLMGSLLQSIRQSQPVTWLLLTRVRPVPRVSFLPVSSFFGGVARSSALFITISAPERDCTLQRNRRSPVLCFPCCCFLGIPVLWGQRIIVESEVHGWKCNGTLCISIGLTASLPCRLWQEAKLICFRGRSFSNSRCAFSGQQWGACGFCPGDVNDCHLFERGKGGEQ